MPEDLAYRQVSHRKLVVVEAAAVVLLAFGIVQCLIEAIVVIVHLINFWVTAHADNAARTWCQNLCPPFNQHGFWHMMGAYPLYYLFGLGAAGLIVAGRRTSDYHYDLTIAAQRAEVRRREAAAAEELERLRSEAFPVDRLTLRPRVFNFGVAFNVIVEVRTQLGENTRILTFPMHRVRYLAAPAGPAQTDAFFPERAKATFGYRITIMTNRPPFWLRHRDNLPRDTRRAARIHSIRRVNPGTFCFCGVSKPSPSVWHLCYLSEIVHKHLDATCGLAPIEVFIYCMIPMLWERKA
jgi:hypothetical protein